LSSTSNGPFSLPRLRQVALATRDLQRVTGELQVALGWAEPFHDPGVEGFGLQNSVFAVGDCFVEVVSPIREGTTAGRYMERRGGDTGYMAIFQVADLRGARRRIAQANIRVVWKVDLPDIAGTHLHPKDVSGAIVSIDWSDPPDSWRWAGPAWTGGSPAHPAGGLAGIKVEVVDPLGAARQWSVALGTSAESSDTGALIRLNGGRQTVHFVPAVKGRAEEIVEVLLAGVAGKGAEARSEICGVRFGLVEAHDGQLQDGFP
jgi:hypothetical protein